MNERRIRPDSRREATIWERLPSVVPHIVIGFIIIGAVPFMPRYLQSMLGKVFIFGLFAMSLNLLIGYTGLLSFGHAAYFGTAGYTAAILIMRYNITSFWLVAPCAILMATLMAAILGNVALRTAGLYFLLVTFALGELLYIIAWKWGSLTGGEVGLVGIPLPDISLSLFRWNSTYFFFFIFLVFVICYCLLYMIVNSSFGYALQGIRDNERRMRSLGYNIWLYKYLAFIIAGCFSGVAGVFFIYYSGAIGPLHLGLLTSATAMLMVFLGGARTFWGPVLGAAVVELLEYFASIYLPARWPLILGGVFIVSVMTLRGGITIHLLKLGRK